MEGLVPASGAFDADKFEDEHVHGVYDAIARHFSHTRYKPWPRVASFLQSLEDGALVADVGCGNGKYLQVNPKVLMMGSDRSRGLVECCQGMGHDVCLADNLMLPYRSDSFDAAISIAVIHHLSTEERRAAAVREILRILKRGGQALIYNWAMEQQGRRKGFTQQDNFIPWQLQDKFAGGTGQLVMVYNRYYHLFVEGESEKLMELAGGNEIVDSFYDHENWCVVIRKL
ncbi:hypothetical protein GUITHDRAFT_157249 [Guillardia theta CCMP2712]|uniref:Methyltransferase type 11 domain-containing protein n=1 Tax=Guillardia theta (strain CCMP2712) TaxID=905079 RepID=L1JQV4_GUITC|nr:hypothetical protein GUITHDRAFT_157249 [Guillardia theta CCMP2712]EKX50807.1 hypothetical protein GUITHDRAFT_157249 [Guillardia theta CCMP2712]|eukprot:XP_005837787.1 hypothetical protein GUITHDRAFT_157249 [Guillardia theta CCMP2712]